MTKTTIQLDLNDQINCLVSFHENELRSLLIYNDLCIYYINIYTITYLHNNFLIIYKKCNYL